MNAVNRRHFLALSGMVAGTAGLAACATATNGNHGSVKSVAPGKLAGTATFWKVPSLADAQERAYFRQQIADFKRDNRNANIRYTLTPWDSATTQLTAAYSARTGPDVTYLIIPWLNQYRNAGALAAFEDIAPRTEVDALFSGTPATIVSPCKGPDGKRYGAPILDANFFLAKNDDVWERADRPTLPITYDDLITFARAMTLDNKGRSMNDRGFDGNNISSYGFNWPTDPGVHANYYWNYLWAYGADYVNKNGTDIGFDNAGGRAGLKVMKDMVDSGATTPAKLFTDSNVAGEILLKGTAGSGWQILTTQATFDKYPKARVSVIGIPKGPAGQFVVGGVGYYSVAKSAQHPEVAFGFIQQLLSRTNLRNYLAQTLTFPARNIGPMNFYGDGKAAKLTAAAAATTKYVRLTAALKFSPEDFILGKIDDYLLGRSSFDKLASDCSKQVKLMARQAKH